MKKIVFAIVVAIALIGVVPAKAEAQCLVMATSGTCRVWGQNPGMSYGGYPLPQPMPGGYNDYRQYQQYRRSFPNYGYLDWNPQGGYYGRYSGRQFNPMLDACGRELKTKTQRVERGIGTVIGTTVLGAILGGKKGAAYGAAGGAAIAVLQDSKYYSNPDEACEFYSGQPGYGYRDQFGPAIGPRSASANQTPPVDIQITGDGPLTLVNMKSETMEVFDGQTATDIVIAPGEGIRVGLPKEGYRAVYTVFTSAGKVERKWARNVPRGSTLEFR